MTACFLGIDPGLDGALALIDAAGKVLYLEDMPTVSAGKGKREVCAATLNALVIIMTTVHPHGGSVHDCIGLVEAVHAMPKQGVSSTFRFGFGVGVVHGVLSSCRVPFLTVTPQRWQKAMLDGHSKGDKSASLLVARRRWPDAALGLKKHHGRADALLIAEWARTEALRPPSASGSG